MSAHGGEGAGDPRVTLVDLTDAFATRPVLRAVPGASGLRLQPCPAWAYAIELVDQLRRQGSNGRHKMAHACSGSRGGVAAQVGRLPGGSSRTR